MRKAQSQVSDLDDPQSDFDLAKCVASRCI